MRTSLFTALLPMIAVGSLFGQGHIVNTIGSGGVFSVKDGSTTFISLSQADGSLSLSNILIFKGADRFIHDYQESGTNGFNTFVGVNSGNFTMAGGGATASSNTGVGHSSLMSLTSGYDNSGLGKNSLGLTTSGDNNSAFGSNTLSANTTGYFNSAFGSGSLSSNTEGVANSSFGAISSYSNINGSYNAAFGYSSLQSNASGSNNSAFGVTSLSSNTGSNNSAFGYGAGGGVTTGSNNTAIGYNAQVADGANSNQIRIGDANITLATTQIAWTTTSDRRWKSNIAQSNLGLEFVSKLNPVVYTRNNDEKQKTEYGFIAQELETVLQEIGVENTGMLTVDSEGMYQLRYNDLLAPMVKAIQELKKENDELKAQLTSRIEKLERLSGETKLTLK